MDDKILGSIVSYNVNRGFGWISDSNDVAFFFHIRETQTLPNGGRVVPRRGDLAFFRIRASSHKPGCSEAYDLQFTRYPEVAPTRSQTADLEIQADSAEKESR